MMPTRMLTALAPSCVGQACSWLPIARPPRPVSSPQVARVRLGALRDRERPVRFAGIHVLLDDAVQPPVESGQRGDQRGHVGLAEGWLDHDPEANRGREAQLLIPYPRPDRRVDLLQVDVRDALGIVADELQVVRSAVGHMPGVQAQVHGPGVRAVKETLDLLLGPDMAVRVGVEREDGPVLL